MFQRDAFARSYVILRLQCLPSCEEWMFWIYYKSRWMLLWQEGKSNYHSTKSHLKRHNAEESDLCRKECKSDKSIITGTQMLWKILVAQSKYCLLRIYKSVLVMLKQAIAWLKTPWNKIKLRFSQIQICQFEIALDERFLGTLCQQVKQNPVWRRR